jgi:hypothetical protein
MRAFRALAVVMIYIRNFFGYTCRQALTNTILPFQGPLPQIIPGPGFGELAAVAEPGQKFDRDNVSAHIYKVLLSLHNSDPRPGQQPGCIRTTTMPTGKPRNDRIHQDVTDISSADQLLCYAIAGQLEQLQKRGYTQGKVAQGAGFGRNARNAGPLLARVLRNGPTADQLHELDEIIGTLDPHLGSTGGLSSLALRLSAERQDKINSRRLAARVPSRWTTKVLANPPANEISVLLQASAVLSEFMAAGKMDSPAVITSIRNRYEKDLELLVRRLILVSVAPPAGSNYDAQIMLGMLASFDFERIHQKLDTELRKRPLGFGVWRAVTKLVRLSEDGDHADALRVWVRQLLRDAQELRKDSLYAGRSLDLELAISVPAAWSPRKDNWVGKALLARARDGEATIRERGTATMGLWQRALDEGGPALKKTREDLRALITEFRAPESRKDAPAGMRWLAATLEHVIDAGVAVCNDWPDVDESWYRNVQAAADELDGRVPAHLLTGTKNLFRHMILQNAGAHRRDAIETLVTSGWSAPVARALGSLLEMEQDEAWLRIRAELALSFLQQRDPVVESVLTRACLHAYARLKLDQIPEKDVDQIPEDQVPPRSHITEVHASLFAVGDCFGVPGFEDLAGNARETLSPILTELASMRGTRAKILRRPARAAAYLLTVTAQPARRGKPDLSQVLLEKLSEHPDPVTARLSEWALSFRFAEDGTVRPLLAAVEYDPDGVR